MITLLKKDKIFFCVIFFLIFLQLLLLMNSRYTVWPEMILYPFLMQNKFLLYKDIINPYFPLLPTILNAYFNLFGLSIENLKILTYLFIFLTDLIIVFASLKFFRSKIKALLSLTIYIILNYSLGGNGLWFELSLTPFLISSLLIIFFYSDNPKLVLLSGILFSLSIFIKQNSILVAIPVFYLLLKRKNFRSVIYFSTPVLLAVVLLVLLLIEFNILRDFVNWALLLPLSYSSQPGFVLLPTKRHVLLIILLFLTYIGQFRSLNKLKKNSYKINNSLFWLVIFILASLFALPRYEDFHLQVLVALSAIFAPNLPTKVLLAVILLFLIIFHSSFIKMYKKEDRFIDKTTYFLSNKIREFDSVYLLNSPDLAYFFANKLPPKPWAINFPWYFENFNFERRFINQMEINKIESVIIGDRLGGDKYALGNYIPENLLEYINLNYKIKERYLNYQIWQKK